MIEVHFPVMGATLPADHGYPLFAAISRLVPVVHTAALPIRVGPIPGLQGARGVIQIFTRSRIRIRLPAEAIPLVLPLAGKRLDLDGHCIRLGVPHVTAIRPAAVLRARIVTFRQKELMPETFLQTVESKLAALCIRGQPTIPRIDRGTRAGELRRQVLRVKGHHVIGYALRIVGLSAEDSVKLQEEGLGGRRHLGGGFFVSVAQEGSETNV